MFASVVALCLVVFGQNCSSGFQGGNKADVSPASPTPLGSPPGIDPTFSFIESAMFTGSTGYKLPYKNYQPTAASIELKFDSSNNPIVRSTCGVFKSSDRGDTFTPMTFAGVESDPRNMYFDGNNVYISTVIGLYKSSNSGLTFQLILDRSKAQNILDSKPSQYKCSSTSLGAAFQTGEILASGDLILVSTSLGILRSTDGGLTFAPVTVVIQGYVMGALQNITRMMKKDNAIYISAAGGGPRNANTFRTFHAGTNEACTMNPALPGGAMIVSTDGGATFGPAPGIGNFDIIQNFDFSPTRTHILASNQHYFSALDGQSFTGSTSTSFSPVAFSYGDAAFPLAATSTRVFTTRSESNRGESLILVESLNDGIKFNDRQIDPQIPASDVVVTGVYARGSDVYITSDKGLYISRDGGATFAIRKRFSSDFCTVPWWQKSTVSGFVGDTIFTLFPGFTPLRSSTDQGKQFTADDVVRPGIPNGENGVYLSHVSNMTSVESTIHFGFYSGGTQVAVTSFDGGKTFQPFAENDPRYNGKKIFFLGGSFGAFYVSADGVDERNQLQILDNNSTYVEAYSVDGRMVVSRYGQGLMVLKGGTVENSYPEAGGFPKIREVGGVIFAIGTVTMVSFDKGKSFQRAKGSPYFGKDIVAFGRKVYLITLSSNSIYESNDSGQSFHPAVGRLE